MEYVFHESKLKYKDSILEEGLKPDPKEKTRKDYITKDQKYLIGKEAQDEDYGACVVDHLVISQKPDNYPDRLNSVFFHSKLDNVISYDLVFKVNTDSIELPVYQVDYNLVFELFISSMRSIHKKGYVEKPKLDNKIEEYWNNMSKVNSWDELEENVEIFSPGCTVDPEHLTVYYENGDKVI